MMLQSMMMFGSYAKMKLRQLISDEKGAVDIVAIVVLIGIAVLLAVIFKDQIAALLESLFGTITKTANNTVNGE
ncbi:MAG: flagellin-like protein [Ruminiclostridium sp.]|nr:flagellin-like protein [Ruminiclostridium sp.]